MTSRIGIYPGTFDPIHPGHLAFAEAAMQACGLDEIVFLPERRPRGKSGVTDITHRAALIELAAKPLASCRVVHLASDQFTVGSTMPELRAQFGDAHLTFLMGSDVVQTFRYRWDGLGTLFRDVSFAVGMRAGDDPDEVAVIMAEMEQEHGTTVRYTCIHAPAADHTSSRIRNGIANMQQLSPAVLRYIREHGLYPGIESNN